MMTLSEVSDICENINEQAHQEVWDTWVEADRLADSDLEADWDRAEDQRELASRQQAEWFRDLYHDLSDSIQRDIEHWIHHDQDFCEQFESWFGEEEFHRTFGGTDISDGGDPD
jgi:hypothetical protein